MIFDKISDKFKIVVSRNGKIISLMAKFQNEWKKISFHKDQAFGTGLSIICNKKESYVDLVSSSEDGMNFIGWHEDVKFDLKYINYHDTLAFEIEVTNNSHNTFEPTACRFTTGIDCIMDKYPEWNDKFFPTLSRCELTHFWSYLMSPNGNVISFSSPDRIASWANIYSYELREIVPGVSGATAHKTCTTSVDLLHELPLPPRHPRNMTCLRPGETKKWTIYMNVFSDLDEVKKTLSDQLHAPFIEANLYSITDNSFSDIKIFSPENINVTIKTPSGKNLDQQTEKISRDEYAFKFFAEQGPGVYVLEVDSANGKTSQAVFTRLLPFSYYLASARKASIKNGQYASSHLEQWLGLHSGLLSRRYIPDKKEDEKVYDRLNTIFSLQWDNMKPNATIHHYRYMSNTAQMASVMTDRYQCDNDIKYLEIACGLVDYVLTCQSETGYFISEPDSNSIYTTIFYPAKSIMEVMEEELEFASDKKWQDAYSRHYEAVKRAMDHLVTCGSDLETEGQVMYEDGMISCAATQLAMFALLQKNEIDKIKYQTASKKMLDGHRCLSQQIIPDSRMNGATLRYWESQWDVLIRNTHAMINSPHGWSAWKIYGLWYMYLLTGEAEWMIQTMNALGAGMQLVDFEDGELRWSFIPDPYIVADLLEREETTPGKGRKKRKIIGEEYLSMISGFHYPESEPVSGNSDENGWCCNNDVHEYFKCMCEIIIDSAYVIENDNGEFLTFNCKLHFDENDKIIITPNEEVVSKVNVNLKSPGRVTVVFADGAVSGEFDSRMSWIYSGNFQSRYEGRSI